MTAPIYALWGIPKGQTDALHARVLLSEASAARCDAIEPIAARDGWHTFRRQLLDSAMPDFAGRLK